MPIGLTSFLADSARILTALVSWNWRKSHYRRAPNSRRCPCQAPSDSGRALETRCEASLLLDRPERFRVVCPLLVSTPVGWRCAVDRADVRPFWIRAVGLYGTLAFVGYLIAVGTVFVALQSIGYRAARLTDVAWPPRWSALRATQADYFRTRAFAALKAGEYRAALLALSTAYTRAPEQLETGLLLARLREQFGEYAAADQLFAHLRQRFVNEADAIATVQHDALLVSGRPGPLLDVALDRLVAGATPRGPWLQALVQTLPMLPRPTAWSEPRQARLAQLPTIERALIAAAIAPQAEASAIPPPTNSTEAWLRARLLIAGGHVLAAYEAITDPAVPLDAFQRQLLLLALARQRQDAPALQRAWDELRHLPLDEARLAWLCAQLTEAPVDLQLATWVGTQLAPLQRAEMLAACWVAAQRCGDPRAADVLARRLESEHAIRVPAWPRVLDRAGARAIATQLPLPREVVSALARSAAAVPRAR